MPMIDGWRPVNEAMLDIAERARGHLRMSHYTGFPSGERVRFVGGCISARDIHGTAYEGIGTAIRDAIHEAS